MKGLAAVVEPAANAAEPMRRPGAAAAVEPEAASGIGQQS